MKTINLETILEEIFKPSSQDCSTPREDLQLAITLNPSLNKIKEAMLIACKQTIELCAENAELEIVDWEDSVIDGDTAPIYGVDSQSILNTEKQII